METYLNRQPSQLRGMGFGGMKRSRALVLESKRRLHDPGFKPIPSGNILGLVESHVREFGDPGVRLLFFGFGRQAVLDESVPEGSKADGEKLRGLELDAVGLLQCLQQKLFFDIREILIQVHSFRG